MEEWSERGEKAGLFVVLRKKGKLYVIVYNDIEYSLL